MCRVPTSSLYPDRGNLFHTTDVLLPPILLGFSLVGNLLVILLTTRHYLRFNSPVYIYFTTISALDVFALLSTLPAFVQNLGLFPPNITHGREIAYAIWLQTALFQLALRQAAGWLTALMGALRTLEVFKSLITSSKPTASHPHNRWTRLSASRIVAFVVVVFCFLLNLPRLFTSAVVPPDPDCNKENSIWMHNITQLAHTSRLCRDIVPVVSAFIGHVIPLVTCILFAIVLSCNLPHGKIGREPVIMRTPQSRDEAEFQVSVCVFTILVSLAVLEAPTTVLSVLRVFFYRPGNVDDPSWLPHVTLIANSLSCIRCTVNFVILLLTNHDFRKAFRRTFCCCVSVSYEEDQFYEPMRCCCRSQEQCEDDSLSPDDDKTVQDKLTEEMRASNIYESFNFVRSGVQGVEFDNDKALWI